MAKAEGGGGPERKADDKTACIACREPILRGASICIHCDSVQDWTRYLLRWTGLGTALLALLPLWSGALALRELAFPDDRSEVKSLPVACSPKTVTLAVTNSGNRPGILSGFLLRIVVDGRLAKEEYDLVPRENRRVIRPNETFTLELEPRIAGAVSSLPSRDGSAQSCEYRIETRVEAFDLKTYSTAVSCPCAE